MKIAQPSTILLGVLLIILTYPALAESCSPGAPKTIIFYLNGIDNSQADAIFSREIFRNKFIDFLSKTKPPIPGLEPSCLRFRVAYSSTNGKILDIYEAFMQKNREESSLFWQLWSFLIPDQNSLSVIYLPLTSQIDPSSYVKPDDLSRHVNAFRSEIDQGNKVLVVAHSQGNFYANLAYASLQHTDDNSGPINMDGFGIVSVATPSSFVAGKDPGEEPYVTLFEDLVITAVTGFFPLTLSPNASNGILSYTKDLKGHNFVDAYLAGPNTDSELSMMLKIVGVIGSLKPGSNVFTGKIHGLVNILGDIPDGASVAGNTVFLIDSETLEVTTQTLTSSEGFYEFSVPAGSYILFAEGSSNGDCFLNGSIDSPLNLSEGQIIEQDLSLTASCPGV